MSVHRGVLLGVLVLATVAAAQPPTPCPPVPPAVTAHLAHLEARQQLVTLGEQLAEAYRRAADAIRDPVVSDLYRSLARTTAAQVAAEAQIAEARLGEERARVTPTDRACRWDWTATEDGQAVRGWVPLEGR